MSNQTELYKAAALTFDELGFMFVTPEVESDLSSTGFQAAAMVAFTGPMQGSLVVKLYGDLLVPLASNMLGEDEVPSKEQQLDALGEIANVICGNALPVVSGSREAFSLCAPQVVESEFQTPEHKCALTEVSLPLGSGRAEVQLYVN